MPNLAVSSPSSSSSSSPASAATSSASSRSSSGSSSSSSSSDENNGGRAASTASSTTRRRQRRRSKRASSYRVKVDLLNERCDAVRQDNERLVERIWSVKALCKEGLGHRRHLMGRLDFYGDDFRNVPVLVPNETDKDHKEIKEILRQIREAEAAKKQAQRRLLLQQHRRRSSGEVLEKSLLLRRCRRRRPSSSGGDGRGSTTSGRKRPPAAEADVGDHQPKKRARGNQGKAAEAGGPAMPKRPHNAYFYFCQERRAGVQRELQQLQQLQQEVSNGPLAVEKKAVAQVLADRWNDLPFENKQVYFKLQEDRKKEYLVAMRQFEEAKGIVDQAPTQQASEVVVPEIS